MNIHVVGEGDIGEKEVYRHWIPLVNPCLTYVAHISEITEDNFSIISGGGDPNYLKIIDAAIDDVNTIGSIDRLVIAVDSGELTYQEKYDEIIQHISNSPCRTEIRVVIQHFCLESWALGNQAAISPKPQCTKLREYLRLFDVRLNDPEMLPPYHKEELNREQFAKKYLKRALNDKYRRLSYSKSNPQALLHPKYFKRVKKRFESTRHIQSFRNFLEAFI